MRARDHTARFLAAWDRAGIHLADIAVRRTAQVWIWHRNRCLTDLPLAWARAENARRSDVYIRPARGFDWPMVFLDDLPLVRAQQILQRQRGIAVYTSPQGGVQLWLSTTRALDERDRYLLQRTLAHEHAADLGSISGEHLGRLPGLKNWKRAGVWVNLLREQTAGPRLDPRRPLRSRQQHRGRPGSGHGVDSSDSAREWGWVCGALESGTDPDSVFARLVERARPRRGSDAERYARHTVDKALRQLR